jgi:hypothetical protein
MLRRHLVFVLLAAIFSGWVVAASGQNVRPDPGDLRAYAGATGQTLQFQVTGLADGDIYGTGIYTLDSPLAMAAVHAGMLRLHETGVVSVQILPGRQSYQGSEQNGISSWDYTEYDQGSYSFVGQPVRYDPSAALPDPGNLSEYSEAMGQTLRFDVTGSTEGVVWGDGVYTLDSTLAAAAVHAGVLQRGQHGIVTIQIVGGQDEYPAMQRNGILSREYGPWSVSYQFVRQ